MCLERERARARGEKRVYFSDTTSAEDDGDEAYDGIVQGSEVDIQGASARRPPLEPSHSSSGVDEFFDADEGDDDDRSFYTDADEQSMHSRYSVLDPDRSAAVREAPAFGVAALQPFKTETNRCRNPSHGRSTTGGSAMHAQIRVEAADVRLADSAPTGPTKGSSRRVRLKHQRCRRRSWCI